MMVLLRQLNRGAMSVPSRASDNTAHYARKAQWRHKLERSPQKLISDMVKSDVPAYERCTLYI
jgi:hypothetical protein